MFLSNNLLNRISAYSVVLNITRIFMSLNIYMYNLKGLIETATVLKTKTLQNEAIHLSHNKIAGIFLLCNNTYKKDKELIWPQFAFYMSTLKSS